MPDEPVTDPPGPAGGTERHRGEVIAAGVVSTSRWTLRLLVVGAGAVVLGLLVGRLWGVVLPVLLALVVCTVLWPPVGWLRRHGWRPAPAVVVVVLAAVAVASGVLALVVPPVLSQVGAVADQASGGLSALQDLLTGPPLRLSQDQVGSVVDGLSAQLRSSAATIAGGVATGVGAATSALVTLGIAAVLTFYFLKDGPRFLPWLRGVVGRQVGGHLDAVLGRAWRVLGDFIRTQAVVATIDAVFIGAGLVVLGVPLALPLAVVTFLGGFVPIVGAFVAGGLAVLVALVSNGPTTALLVLLVVVVVQQLEGNVLSPVLQGRSLGLHGAVVLLAVTGGGGLFGVVGAFLAVPVVAVAATVLGYLGEVVEARSGESAPDPDPDPSTEPGAGPASSSRNEPTTSGDSETSR